MRKTRVVQRILTPLPGLAAGETALAHYSMLAEPVTQTVAIAARNWTGLVEAFELTSAHPADERRFLVETWSYDPASLSDSDLVDRLSLYLSVRDHADERVAQAAEYMLREITW